MASGFGPAESPIGHPLVGPHPHSHLHTPTPLFAPASVPPLQASAPVPISAEMPPTPRRTRLRKAHPSDRFLSTQEVQNQILKEMIEHFGGMKRLMAQQIKILARLEKKLQK